MSLAAIRGRRAEFAELAENVILDATERGEGLMLAVNDFLGGTLNNGLGYYADALSAVGWPWQLTGFLALLLVFPDGLLAGRRWMVIAGSYVGRI